MVDKVDEEEVSFFKIVTNPIPNPPSLFFFLLSMVFICILFWDHHIYLLIQGHLVSRPRRELRRVGDFQISNVFTTPRSSISVSYFDTFDKFIVTSSSGPLFSDNLCIVILVLRVCLDSPTSGTEISVGRQTFPTPSSAFPPVRRLPFLTVFLAYDCSSLPSPSSVPCSLILSTLGSSESYRRNYRGGHR